VSKEKSQFENVTMPTIEGGAVKKTGLTLPAGFSVGKNLEKEKPVSRAESVKSFVPSFQSQVDRAAQEEKETKARIEKEGMNYDLYLLIKEKLAEEFNANLLKSKTFNLYEEMYDLLKQTSLLNYIKENPKLYTPNSKDIQFIANNLKEFFPEIQEYQYKLGVFLNSFVYAYFNSVPEEKRKDLKLNLSNTKNLSFIGSELSFGLLKVEEIGMHFGYQAHGSAILEAEKAGSCAGKEAYGSVRISVKETGDRFGYQAHGSAILEAEKAKDIAGGEVYEDAYISVKEAGHNFGYQAHGSAILKAEKAKNFVGERSFDNAHIFIKEAEYGFGNNAHGSAILEAKKVGDSVGTGMHDDAIITITEKYGSIGVDRKDNSKIILPDGRILKAGESV
jgi:hypothetical protein